MSAVHVLAASIALGALAPAVARGAPPAAVPYPLATEDELRAAVLEATGFPDDGLRCTERLGAPFEGVVRVGHFVDDFGCTSEGYFADGVYVDDPRRSAAALSLAGWSDPAEREALAIAWTGLALLTGGTGWHRGQGYGRPHARLVRDGTVRVRGYHRIELGPQPGLAVESVRVIFSPEGDVIRVR